MTLIETKVFEAEDGSLVESADTEIEKGLRDQFDTHVGFHGRCPIVEGQSRAGFLVKDKTPDQVVEAFKNIGYNLEDVVKEDGYKRVFWPKQ